MRRLLVCCALLLPAFCWAYHPPGNISRGVYCAARPLLSTLYWGGYGDGFSFSTETAHSGAASLKLVSTDASGRGAGAWQTVSLGQTAPGAVRIAGWSKAEGVSAGGQGHQYSLYVDMVYADGTSLPMQLACFSPGTHDWEYVETIVKPEKPLASARLYAMLRQRTGAVYFDDVFLGPVDGPNLVANPGAEVEGRTNAAAQQAIYDTYRELNANGLHTYLPGAPAYWRGADGSGNPDVRAFLKEAASHGLGVWLTTGAPEQPLLTSADAPGFPQYDCVNGAWGAQWVETLRLAAAYDFAGLSLVPDEYNWTNGAVKTRYEKSADPRLAEFYSRLPSLCDCPVCRERFERAWGERLPDLSGGLTAPGHPAAYLKYLRQRYDSTTAWIARGVAAVRQANPKVQTDSLICVSPICSDQWWGTGVAWDRLNETGLQVPTTDPYILLHNYLGDSTHWYVTETAAHLCAATPGRRCGIVLEGSRLRPEHRELDPVEIYGSALSAVAHGATELAFWHYDHLTDASKTTDRAAVSRACVKGVYGLLEEADPWLGGLRPLPRVAYLHSRAADDYWRFYTQPDPAPVLTHPGNDPRYAAVAQKELLYYLLRRGVPTDLYYLEAATEAQLAPYGTVVVPFAFAVADRQAALLQKLARGGKQVIVVSELGALDELGLPRQQPALLGLCGLKRAPSGELSGPLQVREAALPAPAADEAFTCYDGLEGLAGTRVLATVAGRPAILTREVGKGRVTFLGGPFAYDLPQHRDNQKRTRTERIVPDPLRSGHAAVLDALLARACGTSPALPLRLPEGDLEATWLVNRRGEGVVLATNWESRPLQCALRLPAKTKLQGFRLQQDGTYRAATALADAKGVVSLNLQPQEATLWHAVK